MIVASKALSGIGQPVAIIMYDERLDVWRPGAHTGTFRGNQLAFAAGAEAVEIVRRDDVLGNVRARAAQIARPVGRAAYHPVGARRARPRAHVGDRAGRPDDRAAGGGLAARCRPPPARGLILELGGRDDCVVRLLPRSTSPPRSSTSPAIIVDALTRAHRGRAFDARVLGPF